LIDWLAPQPSNTSNKTGLLCVMAVPFCKNHQNLNAKNMYVASIPDSSRPCRGLLL
jgi:hypothetical protein